MIQGIRGIHHIALSVPDLDGAVGFYSGVLGFEKMDEFEFGCSETVDRVTGLDGAAARSVMLCAGNVYLELFEFSSPVSRPQGQRPLSDHGYTHLALDVEDIWAAYESLAARGVKWHHPPIATHGEGEPAYFMAYGRDPFGNVIEIQQMDPAYEFHLDRLGGKEKG